MSEHMPAPRLQFRWKLAKSGAVLTGDRKEWALHYEIVLQLRTGDARRNVVKNGVAVGYRERSTVPLREPVVYTTDKAPGLTGDGMICFDVPMREMAPALVDAEQLGGLPIFMVAPDGKQWIKREAN